MNETLFKTLESLTEDAAAFNIMPFRLSETLYPIYGDFITEKRDLYAYIYPKIDADSYQEKSDITSQDMEKTNKGAYNKIDNSARFYMDYFEGFYKSSDLFIASAPVFSSEYIRFEDFPEVYTIFRSFFTFMHYSNYIVRDIHKGTLHYNIPLLFMPAFAAFIRVIYKNKKPAGVTAKELIGKLDDELEHIIFTSFPLVHSGQPEQISESSLKLLYRLNLCTLYKITTIHSSDSHWYDPLLVMPVATRLNPAYMQALKLLRANASPTFFTIVLEVYWKEVWKPFLGQTDLQEAKSYYSYDGTPSPAALYQSKELDHVNKMLTDKYNSYFSNLSSVVWRIRKLSAKCATETDTTKHWLKIQSAASKYLDEIADYNKDTLSTLCQNIHECLTRFARSSGMPIEVTDLKETYNDYKGLFYNTFGLYDMIVFSSKLIAENTSLSAVEKYAMLSKRVLPYLHNFNRETLHLRFLQDQNFIRSIIPIKNIAPLNFQNDCTLLQQLFLSFRDKCDEAVENEPSDELGGFFDSLAKKISASCPEDDSLFPVIFHRITGSL